MRLRDCMTFYNILPLFKPDSLNPAPLGGSVELARRRGVLGLACALETREHVVRRGTSGDYTEVPARDCGEN